MSTTCLGHITVNGEAHLVFVKGEDLDTLQAISVPFTDRSLAGYVDAYKAAITQFESPGVPETTSVEGSIDPTNEPVPEESTGGVDKGNETPADSDAPVDSEALTDEQLEAATAPETTPVDETPATEEPVQE